jgi:hypothetical protein
VSEVVKFRVQEGSVSSGHEMVRVAALVHTLYLGSYGSTPPL